MRQFLAVHGLKYELDDFEKLIDKALPVLTREIEVDDSIDPIRRLFDHQVEMVRGCMRRDTLRLKDPADIRTYVGLYKEAFMLAAGRALVTPKPGSDAAILPPTKSMVELKHLILDSVDQLLEFLETSHSKYFDMDFRVPTYYVDVVSPRAEVAARALRDRLSARLADSKLLDLFALPFRQMLNSGGKGVFYRTISNLRLFQFELSRILQSHASGTLDDALLALLHNINFNYVNFFDYCTSKVLQQLAQEKSAEKQKATLIGFRMYIQHIPVRSGITFDLGYDPLRLYLQDWIEERIKDIDREVIVTPAHPRSSGRRATAELIPVDMSTNELAFLSGSLIETELVPEGYRSQLAEVFAANFQTKNSERINMENFRKKSYERSPGVREVVRGWARKLIRHTGGDNKEKDKK